MVRVLPSGVPFLPKDCASPPASSVKALHFAPINANCAALTAHAAKRPGRLGRALFFVQQSAAAQKAKTHKQRSEQCNQNVQSCISSKAVPTRCTTYSWRAHKTNGPSKRSGGGAVPPYRAT